MTLEDLARLVKKMRDTQKTFYFHERSRHFLNISEQQLEKAVDAAVKEVLDEQGELF